MFSIKKNPKFLEQIKLLNKPESEFASSNYEFASSDYELIYKLLTPSVSWNSYDIFLYDINVKKINLYMSKNNIYHLVYEYINPTIGLPDLSKSFVVSFNKEDLVKFEPIDIGEEKYVNNHIDLVKNYNFASNSIILGTYYLCNDIVKDYLLNFYNQDSFEIYDSTFKYFVNFFYTKNNNELIFNNISLINAFAATNLNDFELNITQVIQDNLLDLEVKSINKTFNINKDLYILVDSLNICEIVDQLINKCTNQNFKSELLKLYIQTYNLNYIKLLVYFNNSQYEIDDSTREVYKQQKFKNIKSYDDIIYNKKLFTNNDFVNWSLRWELTLFKIMYTNSNNSNINTIILNCYIGNCIKTTQNNLRGINKNSILMNDTYLLSSVLNQEEVKINKEIIDKSIFYKMIYNKTNVDYSKLPLIKLIIDLNNSFLSNMFLKFIFYNFQATNSSLLIPYQVAKPLELDNVFLHIIKTICENERVLEKGKKLYTFVVNTFNLSYSKNSLNIIPSLNKLISEKKINKETDSVIDFINFVIDNPTIEIKKKNYPNFVFEPNKLNLLVSIFKYVRSIKLLNKLYEVHQLNIDFEIESELFIKKIIEMNWYDGFKQIFKLTGGEDKVKYFLNSGKIKLTDIPIKSYYFPDYFKYLIDKIVILDKDKKVTNNKLLIAEKYVLEFLSRVLTYADDVAGNNIEFAITTIIKKFTNNKFSNKEIQNYWQSKLNGENIYHMVIQTQNIDLMEFVFIKKKDDIRLSASSLSDTNRNILYYIKSVKQLEFILKLPFTSDKELLKNMFNQVDINGKSVMYTWFTKSELREDIYKLLSLILPMITLDYNADTVIPGFNTNLTYFIINNVSIYSDDLNDLIQLLIESKLVNSEIDILLLFSENKSMNELTEHDKQKLKNLFNNDLETIDIIVDYCLSNNNINTFINLLKFDENSQLNKYISKFLLNNDISNININNDILLKKDTFGKTQLHYLVDKIFDYPISLSNLKKCLLILSLEEIKSLNLLSNLLQITTDIIYEPNKKHISNCFNFIYNFIKNNISDEEINQILTDNETKSKPIHIYCGFGRSHMWKNVGGYLNIYYYLYGKTTAMLDFRKPSNYDEKKTETIQVYSFIENDFDINLIPDESNKENIPIFDHYLTLPTDEELADYKYSYIYSNQEELNY